MDSSSGFGVPSPKIPRTNNSSDKATRQWSDIPSELLGSIANRLGIIELLCFRGVCKDWNSASSRASAEIESLPYREPWFLLYGESSQCLLLSESSKKYTINIPELDGATTCIASDKGWLLLLKEGSMYFFCPFSSAKIYLPKLPKSEFSDYVAAFSSPPTSPNCMISVACQSDGLVTELYILYRGATEWTKIEKNLSYVIIKKIRCAAYHEGEETFYFFDNLSGLVTFSVKEKRLALYEIIKGSWTASACSTIPFNYFRNHFMTKDMKLRLNLEKDVSISTCGTSITQTNDDNKLVFNECIKATDEVESRCLKGVWIHPRFFQVPPNQSW